MQWLIEQPKVIQATGNTRQPLLVLYGIVLVGRYDGTLMVCLPIGVLPGCSRCCTGVSRAWSAPLTPSPGAGAGHGGLHVPLVGGDARLHHAAAAGGGPHPAAGRPHRQELPRQRRRGPPGGDHRVRLPQHPDHPGVRDAVVAGHLPAGARAVPALPGQGAAAGALLDPARPGPERELHLLLRVRGGSLSLTRLSPPSHSLIPSPSRRTTTATPC